MFLITPGNHDPYFNLAFEEILLKESREDFLVIGINSESVIIGKHQTPFREIDPSFVFLNNIPVIRRISGGGTVYHDPGNLNFTFICNSEEGRQIDFKKYTSPVIEFLRSHGVAAELKGSSDIVADGLKISGNAEHVFRNRVLHHGTLLFDASLKNLHGYIRKDYGCYSTRAVSSNPSHVANLRDKLKIFRDPEDLCKALADYFMTTIDGLQYGSFSKSIHSAAEELAVSKYRSWEWNFAYGPDYVFSNSFLLHGKMNSCRMTIKRGIVTEAIGEGSPVISSFSEKIHGRRHMPEDFLRLSEKENSGFSMEEIFNFF